MYEYAPCSAERQPHHRVEPWKSDSEEAGAAVRLISRVEHMVIGEIERTAEAVCVDEELNRGDCRTANCEQNGPSHRCRSDGHEDQERCRGDGTGKVEKNCRAAK